MGDFIDQRLAAILRKLSHDETLIVRPEMYFHDIPGFRPIYFLQLVLQVEEEFDIDIAVDLEGKGHSMRIADLARLIETKIE